MRAASRCRSIASRKSSRSTPPAPSSPPSTRRGPRSNPTPNRRPLLPGCGRAPCSFPETKPVTASRQLLHVVLWMIGTLLSFCVMAVSIRALSGSFTIMEILTTRAALGLAIVAAAALLRPELRHTIHRGRLGLHFVRNSIHFGAQYLWAASLVLLPLATVFSLEFTMPAWTIVLAPLFLGEQMTQSRIGAVILGLA